MLGIGWLLGGTVGIGTVVYAFGIGPLVSSSCGSRRAPAGPQRLGFGRRRQRFGRATMGSAHASAPKSQGRPAGGGTPGTARWSVVEQPDDATDPDLLIDFAQGLLAAWRQRLGRARHLGRRARRTLGGRRTQRGRQDIAAAHRRRDGASVVGHGICPRRTAGPGRHVRTALPRRPEQLGAGPQVPDGELVRDLVVSAGYAVMGRWRKVRRRRLRPGHRHPGKRRCRAPGRPHTGRCPKANASAC